MDANEVLQYIPHVALSTYRIAGMAHDACYGVGGITPFEFLVLKSAVWQSGFLPLRVIAEQLASPVSLVENAVEALSSQGLVAWRRSTADRRARSFCATEAGINRQVAVDVPLAMQVIDEWGGLDQDGMQVFSKAASQLLGLRDESDDSGRRTKVSVDAAMPYPVCLFARRFNRAVDVAAHDKRIGLPQVAVLATLDQPHVVTDGARLSELLHITDVTCFCLIAGMEEDGFVTIDANATRIAMSDRGIEILDRIMADVCDRFVSTDLREAEQRRRLFTQICDMLFAV